MPPGPKVPFFDAHRPCSDRDWAAVVRGGDFSLAGLPVPLRDGDNKDEYEGSKEEEEGTHEEDENKEEEDTDQDEDDEDYNEIGNWVIERCCNGYVVLSSWPAAIAAYNPLTRALHLFPLPPLICYSGNYGFYIVSSEEDPGMPIRVVYFNYYLRCQAVVGVISSDSSAGMWEIFPRTVRLVKNWAGCWTQAPRGDYITGKMVNGSLYLTSRVEPYITSFNPATRQFTKMDWPPLFAVGNDRQRDSVIGNTKDGRPCIVCSHSSRDCSLEVYFWRRDDNGVEGWILDQTFSLKTIRQFIEFSEDDDVHLIKVTDGIVYLLTVHDTEAPQLLLSFCLETAELKMICEDYDKPVYPYIMAWPPSLVLHDKGLCSKNQALSTPSFEGSYVKVGGETILPASVVVVGWPGRGYHVCRAIQPAPVAKA